MTVADTRVVSIPLNRSPRAVAELVGDFHNDAPACPLPCGSPFLPNFHAPFFLKAMISKFSSFSLRRACVAPLARSQVLSIPAAALRTSAAAVTTPRVSTQNVPWRWAVVSMSLLGMVRLYDSPPEQFCPSLDLVDAGCRPASTSSLSRRGY
jgi:hypothetical protein